jgi:Phage integrase family
MESAKETKAQLYEVRPVDVPNTITKTADGSFISYQHIPAFAFIRWPGGQPCAPINMYFLAKAYRVTGGTLGQYASQLSHITRYCYLKHIPFDKLGDQDIHALSNALQEEKSRYKPLELARNKNTVRQILSRTLQFLMWFQDSLLPATRNPLIGEQNSNPQIQVTKVKNHNAQSKSSETYYLHDAMPEPESVDPKRPISQPTIETIEAMVSELSIAALQEDGFSRRFRNEPDMLQVHLEYMRQRRLFMIWIMKRTGPRASEIVDVSVKAHRKILTDKRIQFPTRKRRRKVAPLRSFPIGLKDATVFQRYLTARDKFINECNRINNSAINTDSLFLGANGAPVKKESLERDFKRLVRNAGYRTDRVCLSMFRHRFITLEVVVHLKEFLGRTGKSTQIMTKTDEASILKRVAAKTGHASIKSLWHYIDLAWEEIDVWGGIDRALERLNAAQQLHDELLEMQHQLLSQPNKKTAKELTAHIIAQLKAILKSAGQINFLAPPS